ncbi:MAG: hypothetical protein R3C40_08840 [Parvularculaceae bacterium]
MLFECLDIARKGLGERMGLRQPLIPSMLDQGTDQLEQGGRRRQLFEQRGEVAFDLVTPDRLALFRAGAVEA